MVNDSEVSDESSWYNDSPMRAIDLYSGVGGWTLGLRMAGVKVVRSYEWWKEANITHNKNFGTDHGVADIRALKLSELDALGKIDIVVGSPPCTQFSFSNRGGNGDIQDGLVDIRKFLEIIAYVRPKFWAMENVPRVAGILKQQLGPGGQLRQFKDLVKVIEVVDSAEFGVPQNRRRMIAGDFPADLFFGYTAKIQRKTLGDVVEGLAANPPIDPVYGFSLPRTKLTDHQHEAPLSPEERRLNEESKRYHPVYNLMQFPDRFDRPSRTVTATCTRVSRESIVIQDPKTKVYRRLTIRERASVQSFPITYQYFGISYANRQKMVGNAIPPLLTYYLASSMRKKSVSEATRIARVANRIHPLPPVLPDPIKVDSAGERYPLTRRFRSAIPGLRFGSGARFELANRLEGDESLWGIGFYFGQSKAIRSVELNGQLERRLTAALNPSHKKRTAAILAGLDGLMPEGGHLTLQAVWARRQKGTGPFECIDKISKIASTLESTLESDEKACSEMVVKVIASDGTAHIPPKLMKNSVKVIAGMLLGARLNSVWSRLSKAKPQDKMRVIAGPALVAA